MKPAMPMMNIRRAADEVAEPRPETTRPTAKASVYAAEHPLQGALAAAEVGLDRTGLAEVGDRRVEQVH